MKRKSFIALLATAFLAPLVRLHAKLTTDPRYPTHEEFMACERFKAELDKAWRAFAKGIPFEKFPMKDVPGDYRATRVYEHVRHVAGGFQHMRAEIRLLVTERESADSFHLAKAE